MGDRGADNGPAYLTSARSSLPFRSLNHGPLLGRPTVNRPFVPEESFSLRRVYARLNGAEYTLARTADVLPSRWILLLLLSSAEKYVGIKCLGQSEQVGERISPLPSTLVRASIERHSVRNISRINICKLTRRARTCTILSRYSLLYCAQVQILLYHI